MLLVYSSRLGGEDLYAEKLAQLVPLFDVFLFGVSGMSVVVMLNA